MAPQLGFASFLECDSSLFFTIRNDGRPKGDTRPIPTDAIASQLVGSSSHSDWRVRKKHRRQCCMRANSVADWRFTRWATFLHEDSSWLANSWHFVR